MHRRAERCTGVQQEAEEQVVDRTQRGSRTRRTGRHGQGLLMVGLRAGIWVRGGGVFVSFFQASAKLAARPAVDRERGAGDEGAGVAREPRDGLRHFGCRADAPEREGGVLLLLPLGPALGEALDHRRVGGGGADGDDADGVRRVPSEEEVDWWSSLVEEGVGTGTWLSRRRW